jgi:hypothetical protein
LLVFHEERGLYREEKTVVVYKKLLGWEKTLAGDGWVGLTAPNGIILAFQTVEEYISPVWPEQPGKPGQMMHLDFKVEHLEQAVEYAISLGARLADEQYFDNSRTMFDPAGHTFCLDTSHT